jgi:hypothetical protein
MRNGRLGALSGAAGVVLAVLASVLFNFYEYLPSGETIAEHLADNATRIQAGGYLGVIAAFLLLWFAGTVKALMRPRDGDGRLTTIAVGGTITAAVGIALTFGLIIAAAARAGSDGGIGTAEALTLYDVYGTVFVSIGSVGLAALVMAFPVLALRTGLATKWVAWVGVIVALGSISPLAYIFFSFSFAFVIGISVWAYMKAPRAVM